MSRAFSRAFVILWAMERGHRILQCQPMDEYCIVCNARLHRTTSEEEATWWPETCPGPQSDFESLVKWKRGDVSTSRGGAESMQSLDDEPVSYDF